MEFSYLQEDSSKSSSDENIDRSSERNHEDDHDIGTGRSYECVFCKRGFTTAQALGGHMNIHRKDRANNNKSNTTKPNFTPHPPSSSSKLVDDHSYANLGFYSSIPRGAYYNSISSTTSPQYHHGEVDSLNYHQLYFPSHVQYSEVLCVENQRVFGQDWSKKGLSLYTNPLNKDKIENNNEVDDLDLELRLGHYP
ncbi:uncharacterized protein [Cicer arietinum]|uniref:Transcriptional regulator SUPERMAN-like n=1 Tax=Cicer arietinum TaxID=3827 RepID=A0A1S2XVH7_CICAR|nr:transcriptional regulator SUPERMAN-like [Cicer arietinum]